MATASISPPGCRNWPNRGNPDLRPGLRSGAQQAVDRVRLPRPAVLKNVANPVTGYRVLQGGAGARPVASRPGRQERAAAQPPAQSAQGGLSHAWEWYVGLPRLSAVMMALAVFMFLINLFSGLDHIWFQWPATVFLLIAFLRAASRSRRS